MEYNIKNTILIADDCLSTMINISNIYYDKSNGYMKIKSKKTTYLHRFIVGAKKGEIVDHKNRNKLDCRKENLRIVSKNLNNYNKETKNKLGRGIYFDKEGNRYRSCISHNNKTLKLGSFKNIEDAKNAYNKKSFELYGSDAFLHKI
jgi:hypothetical protein